MNRKHFQDWLKDNYPEVIEEYQLEEGEKVVLNKCPECGKGYDGDCFTCGNVVCVNSYWDAFYGKSIFTIERETNASLKLFGRPYDTLNDAEIKEVEQEVRRFLIARSKGEEVDPQ